MLLIRYRKSSSMRANIKTQLFVNSITNMKVVASLILITYVLYASGASVTFNDNITVDAVINVKPEDVIYYFYNHENPQGVRVKFDQIHSAKRIFNPKKETLIQIHGWLDGNNSDFNNVVKNATLSTYDINVVVVDWSKVAVDEYFIVVLQMKSVGKYIREFLSNFIITFNYPVSNIKLVGHSLGAHIAGFVGKEFNGTIDTIIGIDPAGPFISTQKTDRLDKTDAQFVQVIHTSGGTVGMGLTIGHADYFPNGGKKQPGCGLDLTGRCAHLRSFWLYAESLRNNEFYAEQCSSYKDFEDHTCSGHVSLMGGYYVDKKGQGVYYLDTNEKSPYAKGKI